MALWNDHPAFRFDHVLDLEVKADRALLTAALQQVLGAETGEDAVAAYLRFFRAREWNVVRSGGLVVSPQPSHGYNITELVRVVNDLERMEDLAGFDHLAGGLENPTQVTATLFEISIAAWCLRRTVHRSIEFGPQVERGRSTKRPDFVWRTQVGDLWCECKEARFADNRYARRLERLHAIAAAAFDSATWDDGLRLDVRFPAVTLNGVERRLTAVITDVQRRKPTSTGIAARNGEVTATVSRRGEPLDDSPEWMTFAAITVGPSPTRLDHAGAVLVLAMDMSLAHRKRAAALIRAARRQLPTDSPGAVFVDRVGDQAANAALVAAVEAEGSIVWAAACRRVPATCVYRPDQQFDNRLLLPDVATPVPD